MDRNRRPQGGPPHRPGPKLLQTSGNPRLVALNTLQDITRIDAYASIALSKRLRDARLERRDVGLTTELVYGVIERRISLDYQLDKRLERNDIDALVRDILRMGAYQILYLTRVPARAAVDESVKLARALEREPFCGLINAILRGIVRDKEADAITWPRREEGILPYLSITHSMPEWIAERLIAAYGEDGAEKILAFRPEERTITLRLISEAITPEAFEKRMEERGVKLSPSRLPRVYHAQGLGDVGRDPMYLEGAYTVQGESSIVAAMVVTPKRAGQILDVCAAPGGKTACLSEMMGGTGRVYAWDIHGHRVEMIKAMAARLRLYNVRPAVRDATAFKEDLVMAMDSVLIDAPCSGLGVMQDKPDVKYRQTAESLESLKKTQENLLDTCCQYVKPGGTLVYSTCTLLPEENEQRVKAFLKKHPEFSPDHAGLSAALPEFLRENVKDGMVQLLSHRDGLEGFFIARLKRQGR